MNTYFERLVKENREDVIESLDFVLRTQGESKGINNMKDLMNDFWKWCEQSNEVNDFNEDSQIEDVYEIIDGEYSLEVEGWETYDYELEEQDRKVRMLQSTGMSYVGAYKKVTGHFPNQK